VCPGRHTVPALITVFGKQFQDWSADYSLYARECVHEEAIFTQVRKEVEALDEASRPLCGVFPALHVLVDGSYTNRKCCATFRQTPP